MPANCPAHCIRLLTQPIQMALPIEDLQPWPLSAFMPSNTLASVTQLDYSGMNSGFYLGAL